MHRRKVWGIAVLAWFAGATPATAGVVNSATNFDEIRHERAWIAAPDAEYTITGGARDVTVFVKEGDYTESLHFAAAVGDVLKPGVYDRALKYAGRGRPALRVDTCNENPGRFEIKDFALGPDGVPNRLWAVFEYQCEEHTWPQFGEIRYSAPVPDGPAYAVPAVQRWSAWDFGRPRYDAPVTVRATGPVQLPAARITGADAAAFGVVSDGCAGRSLGAGGSCEVVVRFAAGAPGARSATLEVGPVQSTLQGFNYGGRTRLDITGQPGEGDPEPPVFGAFTPPDSRFSVHGRNSAAGFWVGGRGGGWTGTFRTANGAPLIPGRYTGVKNNMHLPSPQPEPGMDIDTLWGYGDPCSADEREFTVNEITRYPDDGTTKSMEVAFEHRCTSPPGVLVAGTISFRVGDTTPLAPWMAGGVAAPPSPAGGQATTGPQTTWRCTGRIGVRGTRRANRLHGTRRADRILAGRGDDRISAGRGSDCVAGGAGRDRIAGGAGADVLLGGAGRDVLRGGPGRDRLDCGPGRDTAYAGRGDRTRRCERVR
jgi:hypothetical protein